MTRNKSALDVVALVVTYGNCQKRIERLLFSLVRADVTDIVVLYNGVANEIVDALKVNFNSGVEHVLLKNNRGSAGGFKHGIQYICQTRPHKMIWILDDDFEVEVDSKTKIVESWEPKTVIFSNRVNRNSASCRSEYIQPSGAFLGHDLYFSLTDKKMFQIDIANMPWGPWGGMFCSVEEISPYVDAIRDDLVLYFEDTLFTNVLYRSGFKLSRCLSSIIVEPDECTVSRISPFRTYYSYRSHIVLDLMRLNRKSVLRYLLNALVYFPIVSLTILVKSASYSVMHAYFAGIIDGFRGNLGINDRYRLP